jgi:MarR family transcriptional regulator, transcriptional regulator for hemolysin
MEMGVKEAKTALKDATRAAEPPEPLSENLGWLLSQASYILGTEITAALERVGIAPRGYCVLATAMSGEYTQIELAQRVGVDKTTMVVTLDELEHAELAKRRASSEDRRARVVEVTAAGRRKVAQAEKIVEQIQDDVLASLPANERAALVGGLARLVGGRLSKPADCAHPIRRRAPRG